jgi:hypothetical protein
MKYEVPGIHSQNSSSTKSFKHYHYRWSLVQVGHQLYDVKSPIQQWSQVHQCGHLLLHQMG